MLTQTQLDRLTDEVVAQLLRRQDTPKAEVSIPAPALSPPPPSSSPLPEEQEPVDITSPKVRKTPLVEVPDERRRKALEQMMRTTPARIGVGRAGPRLKTQTLLALRADHAAAMDSVFAEIDPALLERMNLPAVQTRCRDRNEHLTRPDLGRQLDDKALKQLRSFCKPGADVQLMVSDGLSCRAVEANLERILPVLEEGLTAAGITLGKTFFIRYGRVPVEDVVAEALGAKLVCILIGERPGLATAESMSAYLCCDAHVGQPEARRTVVSNIHKDGIAAVEAGAYLVDLIGRILAAGVSGVDFQTKQRPAQKEASL